MTVELVQRAHWGNLEGMNFAGLTRLSTEEEEGEDLESEERADQPRFLTGHDIKSTDEQEKDVRTFVESRGGRYVYTYTEPDTSAWKRRRVRLPDGRIIYRVIRPVFEASLEDLKAGRAPNGEHIDGLIVYDIDRLTREPRHLEDAIETVEHYHRPIIDITGTLDLLTDNGRAMARVIVAIANKQSADTARRVTRKHKAMQQRGIPAGGPRPFGWQKDRRTLEPEEAALIKSAARRVIEGGTWYGIVAEWNREGVPTTQGKTWSVRVLQEVLSNPRVCGYRSHTVREFNPDTGKEKISVLTVYGEDGEPVIGQHQEILSVEEWQAVCDVISSRAVRGSGHNTRKYLCVGTFRCGKDDCGRKLRSMKAAPSHGKPEGFFYYMCPGKATGAGCGGISISGPDADELVRKLVIAHYEEQAQRRQAVASLGAWPDEQQLANIREDIEDLKLARKNRQISAERYYRDLAEYEADEQKLNKSRNAWKRKVLASQGKPIDIAQKWDDPNTPLAEKRAYVEKAFTAIVVLPVGKGSRVPLRERLIPLQVEGD